MKKAFIIIVSILSISLLLLFVIEARKIIYDKEKKLIINYKYTPNGIEIEEYNKSDKEVFMLAGQFLIYREKYNDINPFFSFENGERENWSNAHYSTCVFPPLHTNLYVFDQIKFKGLNKERQKTIMMSLKVDSLWVPIFEKTPYLYSIMPQKKIVLEYRNRLPLEKGRYEIFLNKKAHNYFRKLASLPKEFKIIKSVEIKDNSLEFEVE